MRGAQLVDALLEAGYLAPGDAEHLEKCIPQRLGVGVLAFGALPVSGKGGGARADFVPAQWHVLAPMANLNYFGLVHDAP